MGLANVSWSHIQLEGFLRIVFAAVPNGKNVLMVPRIGHMGDIDKKDTAKCLPAKPNRRFWLDYFCLQQCQPNCGFIAEAVVELIAEIGTFCADIKFGEGIGNLHRSFCALEICAAVQGKVPMVMTSPLVSKSTMR